MKNQDIINRIRQFYLTGDNEDIVLKIIMTPVIIGLVGVVVTIMAMLIGGIIGMGILEFKEWSIELTNSDKVMISKEEYNHLKENNVLYLNYIKGITENTCQK